MRRGLRRLGTEPPQRLRVRRRAGRAGRSAHPLVRAGPPPRHPVLGRRIPRPHLSPVHDALAGGGLAAGGGPRRRLAVPSHQRAAPPGGDGAGPRPRPPGRRLGRSDPGRAVVRGAPGARGSVRGHRRARGAAGRGRVPRRGPRVRRRAREPAVRLEPDAARRAGARDPGVRRPRLRCQRTRAHASRRAGADGVVAGAAACRARRLRVEAGGSAGRRGARPRDLLPRRPRRRAGDHVRRRRGGRRARRPGRHGSGPGDAAGLARLAPIAGVARPPGRRLLAQCVRAPPRGGRGPLRGVAASRPVRLGGVGCAPAHARPHVRSRLVRDHRGHRRERRVPHGGARRRARAVPAVGRRGTRLGRVVGAVAGEPLDVARHHGRARCPGRAHAGARGRVARERPVLRHPRARRARFVPGPLDGGHLGVPARRAAHRRTVTPERHAHLPGRPGAGGRAGCVVPAGRPVHRRGSLPLGGIARGFDDGRRRLARAPRATQGRPGRFRRGPRPGGPRPLPRPSGGPARRVHGVPGGR